MNITEKNFVLESYELIASQFDKTRGYLWKGVKEFLIDLKKNSLVFDAGCGNGKNMLFREDITMIGCDFCKEFTNICKNKQLEITLANIKHIPYRNNIFDAVISIAVLHHISNVNERIKVIKELVRITKPNGKIMIQVWEDMKNKTKKFKCIDKNDYYVTWERKKDKKIIKRFYHLFKENELKELIINSNLNVEIEKEFYEMENWGIILKKNE